MELTYILAALASGIYTTTYAFWIKRQGNTAGFVVMLGLSLLGIGLPIYHMFRN